MTVTDPILRSHGVTEDDRYPLADLSRSAERAAVVAARNAVELAIMRQFVLLMGVAFGAWMVMTGALLAAGGPDRLTSPIFDDVKRVPWWPYSWAAVIAAGGALMLAGIVTRSMVLSIAGALTVSCWHFAYAVLVWMAIAFPTPGARLTSWHPIADHGTLSALAMLGALRLLRVRRLARGS